MTNVYPCSAPLTCSDKLLSQDEYGGTGTGGPIRKDTPTRSRINKKIHVKLRKLPAKKKVISSVETAAGERELEHVR